MSGTKRGMPVRFKAKFCSDLIFASFHVYISASLCFYTYNTSISFAAKASEDFKCHSELDNIHKNLIISDSTNRKEPTRTPETHQQR